VGELLPFFIQKLTLDSEDITAFMLTLLHHDANLEEHSVKKFIHSQMLFSVSSCILVNVKEKLC